MVFDTETTSLEKPFSYNIGYVIANIETRQVLIKRDFVAEQVWHNLALFQSAYYVDKRPLYISRMKAKQVKMLKFGYITQQMIKDIEDFEITQAYAYNSPFDEKVFDYNCEWFKCINPFDNVAIYDIRAYVHKFVAFTKDFQEFCEKMQAFTESGNYSTTAETLFRYFSGNVDFNEEHTALADSEIEKDILFACIDKGAEFGKEYKVYRSIPRNVEREFKVVMDGKETVYKYVSRRDATDKSKVTLKSLSGEGE